MLQNLSGKASIIGRSLSLYKVVSPSEHDAGYDEHDDELITCCVIGRDDSLSEPDLSKIDVKRTGNYWDQLSDASAAFNPEVGHFNSPQSS